MNQQQKQFTRQYLSKWEMTWNTGSEIAGEIKVIHSSEIEGLYKSLKALEQ